MVDFCELNKCIVRSKFETATSFQAVRTIPPGMTFFTVVDALKGYRQVRLDDKSAALTTFSTPFGRFQYLCLPFGVTHAGDDYARREADVFDDLPNYRPFSESANKSVIFPKKLRRRCTLAEKELPVGVDIGARGRLPKSPSRTIPELFFYDPARPTALHVNASCLHGLGFVLKQDTGRGCRVVQAGSRVLSDPETKYAMIELECLGAAWAMGKCRQFLEGLWSFELISNHKPLVPILIQFSPDKLDNPQILRLRLKMQRYAFITRWGRASPTPMPTLYTEQAWDYRYRLRKRYYRRYRFSVSAGYRRYFQKRVSSAKLSTT